MRCKNCGTENDENRYICENCGSPLYDENNIETQNNSATQTFGAVQPIDDEYRPAIQSSNDTYNKGDKNKLEEKKSIIVIAILAVVLIAIIISVVLIAHGNSGNTDTTASNTQSTVSTASETSSYYGINTTKEETTESTTKETTTEQTTTTTTKKRETTTELKTYSIKLISQGGGTVEGSGTYEEGENVTIVANPDNNYEFEGWYSNGKKISSSMAYSFTAAKDISISAVFVETTTAEDIEDLDGGLD
ncbi:MAG: zinc-ribbon domain-containing protein [Acetobacter sp.]|nr:zinc-ribbon domain-containing protein [Bacteroides sp.]MCM1341256.1 zinc-ribbon domain-containing protein [Acetobacter sp.]MCM1433967.1 zinc-ribbon domain-containing protein [Clostridiales bacterium]